MPNRQQVANRTPRRSINPHIFYIQIRYIFSDEADDELTRLSEIRRPSVGRAAYYLDAARRNPMDSPLKVHGRCK